MGTTAKLNRVGVGGRSAAHGWDETAQLRVLDELCTAKAPPRGVRNAIPRAAVENGLTPVGADDCDCDCRADFEIHPSASFNGVLRTPLRAELA